MRVNVIHIHPASAARVSCSGLPARSCPLHMALPSHYIHRTYVYSPQSGLSADAQPGLDSPAVIKGSVVQTVADLFSLSFVSHFRSMHTRIHS